MLLNSNKYLTKELSAEFWFKLHSTADEGFPTIIRKYTEHHYGWRFYTHTGRTSLTFAYQDKNGIKYWVGNTEDLEYNRWHHVALTFSLSATEIKLYQDGKLLWTNTNKVAEIGTNDEIFSVMNPWHTGAGLNDTIDEVRIYNRTLTQGEASVHAAGLALYFQDADEDGLFSLEDIFTVRGANPGARVSLIYTRTGGIIATHSFG